MTQGEWKRLGLHNPSGRMQDGTGDCQRDDCPVGNLTWFEALEFANLRSTREGVSACYALSQCSGEIGYGRTCEDVRSVDASIYDCPGYRLPTSAEWEYAARAGVSSSVYSGEIVAKGPMFSCYDEPVLSSIAWYCANAGALTHPVGKKRANGWGLHDMIGNAGEWVGLLSRSGEDEHPALDVIDSSTHGALAQWRGGAWNLWPHMLRAAAASNDPPNARGPGIGFRLAQTVAAIARSEPRVARSRARH